MDDKVQLSRETIVGDNVVNEDIYPNTNTKSVNDDQAGTALNETIERIWAAINNKVSRIVNTVNGRSGIVVLDSSDVGLENVDNISFNDIKEWVIEELGKVFDAKKMKLFANKAELDNLITQNNLDDAFSPFYVERWNDIDDTRPHIGCIVLDPTNTQHLAYTDKGISGVGCTDDSLEYHYTNDGTPGMKAGELRVKISSDEDALYVDNGLRIDKDAVGGILHFYDGIYGERIEDPQNPGQYIYENGLLTSDISLPYKLCTIYLDGNNLGDNFHLIDFNVHKYDTIVCNFKDYRTNQGNKRVLNAEKLYVKPSFDDQTDTYDYTNSGDGYRVGDILDLDVPGIVAKFIVTSIKDGLFEGPVATVNLMYCEPVDSTNILQPDYYNTKPILRYLNPVDNKSGYPAPATISNPDFKISIENTSRAEGCKIHIEDSSCWIPDQYQLPEGTDFKMMMRGMCIGSVIAAPTRQQPNVQYKIAFNSVRPLIGNSLQFKTYDKQFHSDKFSEVVDIRTRKGHLNSNGLYTKELDVSGLGIAQNWGEYREDGKSARISTNGGDSILEPNRMKRVAVLPGGVTDVMPSAQSSSGGVTIMTDMSLCLIPHDICGPASSGNGYYPGSSQYAINWAAAAPFIYPTYENDSPSYVGVNIFKVVKPWNQTYKSRYDDKLYMDRKYLINMSGLRVVNRWEKLNKDLVGLQQGDWYVHGNAKSVVEDTMESYQTSGGLMVNVGPGLEIRGYYNTDNESELISNHFDDSGKVCVRVDDTSIKISDQNRLTVNTGRGLWFGPPGARGLTVNCDNTLTFTTNNANGQLRVNVNEAVYHDMDIMTNKHPVVNLLRTTNALGEDTTGVSAYINTKYGLGFSLTGCSKIGDELHGAPYSLIIRTKAADVGKVTPVGENDIVTTYRQRLVALENDSLMFDPDGRLISPIDTTKGLTNTYNAKAMSSDQYGNVTVSESGGIAIKAGAGLTFDKNGALTLEADYEVKALPNGFDLNNLSTGNYYATSDTSGTIQHAPTSGLGVFRIEHKPVIPDDNYYIQTVYSFNKPGIVYMRYKTGVTWTAWYHIDGAIID